MKEVIGYLRWVLSGLNIWYGILFASLIVNLSSVAFIGTPAASILNNIGIALLLIVFGKWFAWDGIKFSWNRYKQHRNELFATMKESDK